MTGELDFWPRLILAVLATWRITHLLASEDGPMGWIARFRASMGGSVAGRLMDCFYCLSFWVAAPIAFWISTRPLDWLLAWLALSGAACLCERIGGAEVIMQPMPEDSRGDDDGMLRTETQRIAEHRPTVNGRGDDFPVTRSIDRHAARVSSKSALAHGGRLVALRYLERAPVLVRGPATGRQYEFFGDNATQLLDAHDAEVLLRTRRFVRA